MTELYLPAFLGLTAKLMIDAGAACQWKVSNFDIAKWVNENLLRAIAASLMLIAYVLWMSEGDTPKDVFVYASLGDYLFYNTTKALGLKKALPNMMKRSKS